MRRASAALVLGVLAIFAGCARTVREADLFHPHAGEPASERHGEVVRIERPDTVLIGRLIAVDPARPTLMYCPGNGETVTASWPRLDWLARTFAINVVCVDYRGYGESGGTPTLAAIADDQLAIHDWIRTRFPSVPLVVYGRSIGTGMGAWVAANRPLAGLLLEAPPTTAPDVIAVWSRTLLPWYARWCMHLEPDPTLRSFDRYPLHLAPRVTCPLLVIHGEHDATIPADLGRRVYEACASADKRWVLVPGAGHNDLRIDREPVRAALVALLAGAGAGPWN